MLRRAVCFITAIARVRDYPIKRKVGSGSGFFRTGATSSGMHVEVGENPVGPRAIWFDTIYESVRDHPIKQKVGGDSTATETGSDTTVGVHIMAVGAISVFCER